MYFTRKPQANENEYWLYCNETNSKLLPLFIYTLANTFLQNGDYMYQVDLICTKQGTISDDGDSWVDKHSGYFIKNIEYDSEEGYTTEGFKLKTREVLEADLGDAMLENEKMKDEKFCLFRKMHQLYCQILELQYLYSIALQVNKISP